MRMCLFSGFAGWARVSLPGVMLPYPKGTCPLPYLPDSLKGLGDKRGIP
ncbi:hypothetical protein DVU_0783 [Nitratidesulfovibrio vulgaris str. Hildenborough]|uniref:Uncharacterized protein n=1 Tax=Nitratidesulfovibrio vulgaris (strain ATCC 29579 / DSM 644 / CCUG 34227 / NCIMB 8303 / VKM B-1760 / Hildenborough) TaxID=882 RepID=Q72DZ6_NITV2|nr:hypothetical protein DVU_0783 [Nitratidesulfovibrio vulgaris str. Hildenborough]